MDFKENGILDKEENGDNYSLLTQEFALKILYLRAAELNEKWSHMVKKRIL